MSSSDPEALWLSIELHTPAVKPKLLSPLCNFFSGRALSDFWEMVEKSPVVNYTFTSGVFNALGKYKLL